MPYPSYNPTLVLIDSVKEAGYDPGQTPLALAYSNTPMGSFPTSPLTAEIDTFDHPSCPTFEQALQHKTPGDNAVPRFSPHSSNMGM